MDKCLTNRGHDYEFDTALYHVICNIIVYLVNLYLYGVLLINNRSDSFNTYRRKRLHLFVCIDSGSNIEFVTFMRSFHRNIC